MFKLLLSVYEYPFVGENISMCLTCLGTDLLLAWGGHNQQQCVASFSITKHKYKFTCLLPLPIQTRTHAHPNIRF